MLQHHASEHRHIFATRQRSGASGAGSGGFPGLEQAAKVSCLLPASLFALRPSASPSASTFSSRQSGLSKDAGCVMLAKCPSERRAVSKQGRGAGTVARECEPGSVGLEGPAGG